MQCLQKLLAKHNLTNIIEPLRALHFIIDTKVISILLLLLILDLMPGESHSEYLAALE